MGLSVRTIKPGDAVVNDGAQRVAEIRGLKLVSACFRPGGKMLIGETFPLFLFWMQYANHQEPERNAGTNGQIELITQEDSRLVLKCTGTTGSGSCRSSVELTIRRLEDPVRYVYSVRSSLDVRSDKGWLVTPNPTQGEVEFANVWPDGTFSPDPAASKQFQACYVVTAAGPQRIPHHHLETSDKHNIEMKRGDKFLWLGEDENPCLTVLAEEHVTAGLCAYMWDAHFAFKICHEGTEVRLPAGSHFEAAYELTSIDREEATQIAQQAVPRPAPDLSLIPLHGTGVDRFDRTLDTDNDCRFIWPWEAEGSEQAVLALDRSTGFDDASSLRIDSRNGSSCWKLTTLGPAYGEKPFVAGSRYQLTAQVKTSRLKGKAQIAVRLHREDRGSVFDLHNYETFTSAQMVDGDTDWKMLKIVTPSISPAPDRIHLLLMQEGSGTSWFDNVSFEELT